VTPAARPDDPYAALLRGALVPTAVVAAACAVGAALVSREALLGAVLAAAVVLAFFSASLLVMGRTARSAPQNVMAVALVTYIAKVGLLGVLLIALQDAAWLSGTAFAVTALACAAVWLVTEIRAYSKVRLLVYAEPDPEASGERTGPR
jgi:ATP synthase protein I